MALRFRKSFKVAPGVRINLSKSGISASVGKKGMTANLSKRGTRLTAGIPGTGLSASKLYSGGKKKVEHQEAPAWAKVVGGIAFLAILYWVFR